MEIKSIRWEKGLNTTLSSCFVDGKSYCYILEDTDRGLKSTMTLDEIRRIKLPERTAIPAGRYRVDITWSPRFKRKMLILVGVPGFSGIRVHSGRTHLHTEGCLLPGGKYGMENGDYMVGDSKLKTDGLHEMVAAVLAMGEKVFWTIEDNYK